MAATRDFIRSHRDLVLAIVIPIEICLAVLAWVDMSKRPDTDVRGRKAVWRAFVLINPGNSLFYWLFGRR